MATIYSQLSLADIYKDCQDLFLSDKPAFFSLLENYIDFEEFIPPLFTMPFSIIHKHIIRMFVDCQ